MILQHIYRHHVADLIIHIYLLQINFNVNNVMDFIVNIVSLLYHQFTDRGILMMLIQR